MGATPELATAFPPGRWQASWIWRGMPVIPDPGTRPVGRGGPDRDRRVFFRKVVALDEVPDMVPLRAVADSRYVLWVNGTEVARGPGRGDPRRLRADLVDIAPFLMPGENVLAVLGRYYGRATGWWLPAPAVGLLGGGSLAVEARIADIVVGTDRSWRTAEATAWTPASPLGPVRSALPEIVDARSLPVGWRERGFDDSGWDPATVLPSLRVGVRGDAYQPPSDPYGPLLPSALPPLRGPIREPVSVRLGRLAGGSPRPDPVTQVLGDDASPRLLEPAGTALPLAIASGEGVAHVLIDFGSTVSGTLLLELDAPEGAQVDVSIGEDRGPDGRAVPEHQCAGLRYTARGSDDAFETGDPVGGRFATVIVRSDRAVALRRLDVRERLFPRPEGTYFRCSDPLLTSVYETGLRTVDLCSQDGYLDCPTREQRAWTGGGVVHQRVHFAANPDWSLARWHPQLVASPRPDGMLPMAVAGDAEAADTVFIPDWPLHWIRSVHNVYRYTGDAELIAGLLPVVEGVLRWFLPFQRADGLLSDVTGWVLIDWSSIPVGDTSGALAALWARALRDFAEMASWLGDEGRARWARGRAAAVAAGFEQFWDQDRGGYHDARRGGRVLPAMSQHTNAAALCAGLVPPERVERVVELLADRGPVVPTSWYWEGARGLGEDEALAVLLSGPPEPSWDVDREVVGAQPFFRYVVHDALAAGRRADLVADLCRDWKVFLDADEPTWPETWHGGTRCHGWSSTPTHDLVAYTLGVRPAEPGFARAMIAPRLGDLLWAEGAAPTPAGLLHVAVREDLVEVDSPVPVRLDLGDPASTLDLPPGQHCVRG